MRRLYLTFVILCAFALNFSLCARQLSDTLVSIETSSDIPKSIEKAAAKSESIVVSSLKPKDSKKSSAKPKTIKKLSLDEAFPEWDIKKYHSIITEEPHKVLKPLIRTAVDVGKEIAFTSSDLYSFVQSTESLKELKTLQKMTEDLPISWEINLRNAFNTAVLSLSDEDFKVLNNKDGKNDRAIKRIIQKFQKTLKTEWPDYEFSQKWIDSLFFEFPMPKSLNRENFYRLLDLCFYYFIREGITYISYLEFLRQNSSVDHGLFALLRDEVSEASTISSSSISNWLTSIDNVTISALTSSSIRLKPSTKAGKITSMTSH